MSKTTDSNIQILFDRACDRVRQNLPRIEVIEVPHAKNILRRYTAGIEGNFVAWMGAAVVSARSLEGRFAASENLYVEMRDNHPGMLHKFAKHAGALPTSDDHNEIEKSLALIRTLIKGMSGIQLLSIMATLEYTSTVFIPWLAELAKICGSKETLYTDVHGGADVEHAKQFLWAVRSEALHELHPMKQIDHAIETTLLFLSTLFLSKDQRF